MFNTGRHRDTYTLSLLLIAGASYAVENQYADVASGTWTRMETKQQKTESDTPKKSDSTTEETTVFGNRQILI